MLPLSIYNWSVSEIADVAQVVSLLIGVLLIWWQIKAQRKIASAQLYLNLEQQFNDEYSRKMRKLTAKNVEEFLKNGNMQGLTNRLPALSLLESGGEMGLQGVISLRELNSGFGWYVFGYYHLLAYGREGNNFFDFERHNQGDAWQGIEEIYKYYVRKNKLDKKPKSETMVIARESLNHELYMPE